MKPILVCYASMSGNTELAARLITRGLSSNGLKVEVNDITEMDASLLLNYQGVIIGSYSWGDGDLPDECLDFYDDLMELNLDGKIVAVFGTGDASYPNYCGAVDLLTERMIACGADVVLEKLKIELDPVGEEYKQCLLFGQRFASIMENTKNEEYPSSSE